MISGGQCPGYGDTLLLPAGELGRVFIHFFRQTYPADEIPGQ
jgi:hypothetical protein